MDRLKGIEKHEMIFWITGSILFVYLMLRAVYVPLVYDEAATFFIYILSGEFVPFYAYWDANNHLLNSFAGIICYKIFGYGEWAIRLPNVLFFAAGIFFLYQIRRFFENKLVWLCMALALLLSHNFIEYSAYCRGYGMAISCMIGCIYFFLLNVKESNGNSLIGLSVFSFLALASNFTLLNVVLILTALVVIYAIAHKKMNRPVCFFLIGNVIFLGLTAWLATELKKRGLLYYGSQDGFYKVTLQSISNLIFGNVTEILPIVFVAISLLLLVFYFLKARSFSFKDALARPVTLAVVLFSGSVVAIIVLNIFLKVNFPEDRTALYLYPLFVLFLFFSMDAFLKNKIAGIASAGITLIVAIHFITQVNLSYSAYWKQERMPESFYKHISKEWKGREHEVFISAYRMKGYIWNYYTFKNKQKLNEIYHQDFPSAKADYLIIEKDNYKKNPRVVANFKEVYKDDFNGIRLMKNNSAISYVQIFDTTIAEKRTINYPYVSLLEHKMVPDSFTNVAVEFESSITFDGLCYIDFVFKAMKGNETLKDAVCRTQWQREKWVAPDNVIRNRIFLENVKEADSLVLFINGRGEESYRLGAMKVKVFVF